MKKSLILKIHSSSGLILGLFILVMSFSGAVLIFHTELDELLYPTAVKNTGGKLSIDKAYGAVKAVYQHARLENCDLPFAVAQPIVFTLYDPSFDHGRSSMKLFLDPATNEILMHRDGSGGNRNNFMSWLSKFHSSFHLGKTGEWLLGFFALIFLLSIITGIILFRKNIVAVLLFKKAIYKKNNLHQVIGVYALLFNLMIAVTGFWMQRYVFKKAFYSTDNYASVLNASPALSFNYDSAYNEMQKYFPDFTAHVIYFAQNKTGKTAVYGSRSSNPYIHSKKFADVIFLDSAGSIYKTRFINEIDAADRYDIINSQLHMGRFGGAGIKIIYFIFGLTGGLLSITGFLLWMRRRKEF